MKTVTVNPDNSVTVATAPDGQGNVTTWQFKNAAAALRQRAEFDADLADPSNATAKAALDKAASGA